ncbi:MAG: hypothetical protein ACKO6D_10015, partial [Rubrivivax sp.]
ARIAQSFTGCADAYVGSTITGWASVDPESSPGEAPAGELCRLVASQLGVNDGSLEAPGVPNSLEPALSMADNSTGAL